MKFSERWLREWVNPQISTPDLVSQLSMAGLEVDSVESVSDEFSGVIVGEIVSTERHPDAEKLQVCMVSDGSGEAFQVVCGAANARVGIRVPFATVGAKLPGDVKIKKAKLRGVESFGMLCAQPELQLGEDDSGLWELPSDAPLGADLREFLRLDDAAIEVDLTPNRGDCLSIRGLAREVGVLNSVDVSEVNIAEVVPTTEQTFPVTVSAPKYCSNYCGRVVAQVDVTRASPLWLTERLRRAGLRSIDAVVDVTNYVMLELGQPMHAFDLNTLQDGIDVRISQKGEKICLLDGQELALDDNTLLITDANGPLAIAGIMGGKGSGVSENTQDVFLESACFTPLAMAGKARSYGLHTDSSHRFERGVDPALQRIALERATSLLLEICGGSAGPIVEVNAGAPSLERITLRKDRLGSLLGITVAEEKVVDILTRLGLELESNTSEAWQFSVPSYRFDLAIEEDLVEEIARVYGYDRLPVNATAFPIDLPRNPETEPDALELKQSLIARNYQEVITYSFIDPSIQSLFQEKWKPVTLANPISSDMACMRTTLIPGLVNVLKYNLSRQKTRIKCFELGMRFQSASGTTEDLNQEAVVAGLSYGAIGEVSWSGKSPEVDFFDLKGDVESLLGNVAKGKKLEFTPTDEVAFLHPGQAACVYLDGEEVGFLGALHPATQKELGLSKPVFVFELILSKVLNRGLPRFKGVSRFPEVSRDIAVVVAQDLPYERVAEAVYATAGNCLTNLKLFDVYRGEGIDPERKSLAFSLTFQHPSRTLKDEEINASVASVIARLKNDFDANLR